MTPANRRAIDSVATAPAVGRYVIGAVCTAAICAAAVVLLAVYAPDNATAINTVVGVMGPIIWALLGLGQHKIALGTDGKVTQLIETKAAQQRAEGFIEGLRENPDTNIS